ncbi:MAG: hypothetical protein KH054_11020 [Firmicutes bacterium]|nr:hypothetical protein [Bacillota bacterium]
MLTVREIWAELKVLCLQLSVDIRTLSDKPIVSIDNGHEILYELKRHGNNLNQAVKSGYYGYDTEQEILSAVAECKRVYRKLSEALGGT